MKLTTLLIFVFSSTLFAGVSYSQNTIISLNMENVSLKTVFQEIEKQSEFSFFYNSEQIDLNKKVDIHASQSKISDVLNNLFSNSDIAYKVISKHIVLISMKAYQEMLTADKTLQQNKVSGTVVDESTGEPLIGVAVSIDGTNLGTVTDINGKFSIAVPDQNSVLVVSFVGYVQERITVGTQTTIEVKLVQDIKKLDEVVVVGYGTQKKKNITGAIASVKSKDLEDVPIVRMEDALKGRTAGVTITASSGQPGAASTVMVRGVTSINNTDPLIVVDGVVVGGGFDYLNSSDIESIEVLKDAASAAIYGSKSASGVILVTTKKGKAGDLKVNLSSYYGVQSPAKKLKLTNATEYATLRNESSLAAGNGIVFANPASYGAGTDWQSAIFNNSAPILNTQLSLTGGNEKSTFFASFGYFDQDGIVMTKISNYKRFSFSLNSEHKMVKWLNFGENFSYAYTKSQSGFDPNNYYGTPLSSAINLDPITPAVITDPTVIAQNPYSNHLSTIVRDDQGRPYGISSIVGQEMTNPLAYQKIHEGSFGWGHKFVGNAYLELVPIKGLRIRSTIGADLAFWGNESFTPLYYMSATSSNLQKTSFNRAMNNALNWTWTNTASYSKTIGLHTISALVGVEGRDNTGYGVNGTYNGLPVNTFDDASMNFTVATADRVAGGFEYQPYTLASVFGRLSYDYGGKYLLTGVIRRDGSSHFGSNNVYGTFPALSLGWVPSLEKFWPSNNVVNYVKLRAGYGVNGNDNLSPFQYTSVVSGVGAYPIGGQLATGNAPGAPANPDLKWEQTTQTDVAIDATLFKDLSLTFDVFKKKTTGMLLQPQIPLYVGALNNPYGNVGDMENNGIELELGYTKKIGDVNFDIKANGTYVKNKVTYLGTFPYLVYGTVIAQTYEISRKQVGQPVNSFYGFQTLGVFQTQADINNYVDKNGTMIQPNAKPGDFKWADLDGDGKITSSDRTFLGDPTPHYIYGITLSASYKNFDLRVFGQGVSGNKIYQALRRLDIPTSNYFSSALNRWTGPGTSNSYPRLTDNDANGNFSNPSNFHLEDGAYFKIKTVEIGYNLPKSLLSKIKFQAVRIYVSGNNLKTFTKYSGFDPEIGGGLFSQDHGIYPQARSYMAGINVTF